MFAIFVGKDSFYHPMINVIDDSTILLHWDPEDIKELEDPYILKEVSISCDRKFEYVYD